MRHQGLPRNLDELFPGAAGDRTLDVDLPPGRLVVPQEGRVPAYWLSDEPAGADLWVSLRQAHARSGLWPLLACPLSSYEQEPWEAGDVSPQSASGVDRVNAAEGLEALWAEWIEDGEAAAEAGDFLELEPFGRQWPGLAPAARPAGDPDEFADQYVSENDDGTSRIMLVPVARGADVLTAVGWHGPVNYTENMELLSAVLRSWEDRFGARLVEIGFDTLHLSVAFPAAADDAELLAAEHFAFCPDNIVQGTSATIGAYAAEIQAEHGWTFWWD